MPEQDGASARLLIPAYRVLHPRLLIVVAAGGSPHPGPAKA